MNIRDFRNKLSTINENIYFDKHDYLREKAISSVKINQWIDEAKGLLLFNNAEDTYFLKGTLGNLYRINGQPKKAIIYLTDCLDNAVEEKSGIREVISYVRLGEALKYDNQHHLALDNFNRAIECCETKKVDGFLDFALQHKGKCLMELATLEDAERCFLKALHLRNIKEDASLIDSTQQAINVVREIKLSQGT